MKHPENQFTTINSQENIPLNFYCIEIIKKSLYTFLVWQTIVGIASGILFLIVNTIVVDETSTNLDSFKTYGISYLCITFAVAIMGFGLTISGSKAFAIIFLIINLIFLALFMFVIIYYKLRIISYTNEFNDICKGEKTSGLMQLIARSYSQNVTDFFCTEKCICKADLSKFPSQKYINFNFSNNGKKTVMDCSNLIYVSDDTPRLKLVYFLQYIETNYNCSGLCNTFNFYSFSDVSRGIPEKECGNEILNHFNKYIIGLYVISSINIANFLILSCFAIVYLKIILRAKKNVYKLNQKMENSESMIK